MLLLQNPSGALLKTYRSCNQVSSQSKITLQDLFKFKLHSKISSPSHIAHLVILSLLLLLAHSPIVRSRSIPLPASSTQHHNTHSSQDSADNGRVQLTGEPSNANHYIIVLKCLERYALRPIFSKYAWCCSYLGVLFAQYHNFSSC